LPAEFPRLKIFDQGNFSASAITALHPVLVHEDTRKINATAMNPEQLLER
jgi:hypothetical protein